MSKSHEMLLGRLSRLCKLSTSDVEALHSLPIEEVQLKARQDIMRTNDRPSRSVMITSGLAVTYKDTRHGKRQVLAFHHAGTVPDLQSLHLSTLDASLGTISPCTVGFIRHQHLRMMCEQNHRLTVALWRSTLIEASIYREWMTNLGQRVGSARMAHLFCEMFTRMETAGLSRSGKVKSAYFPVTQIVLGEALGQSVVHVNRMLKELRCEGLVELENETLTILDWEGLVMKAGFDLTYLHLDDDQAL